MDAIDRNILNALQQNCRRPIADIADIVGLSLSACARRISLLEERGYIQGYGARLNPDKLGLNMSFYIELSLNSQSVQVLEAFEAAVRKRPEILECHLMTGSFDYLLKIAAKNTADYEAVYRRIISSLPHVGRIQSALVMKTIKPWAGYLT